MKFEDFMTRKSINVMMRVKEHNDDDSIEMRCKVMVTVNNLPIEYSLSSSSFLCKYS